MNDKPTVEEIAFQLCTTLESFDALINTSRGVSILTLKQIQVKVFSSIDWEWSDDNNPSFGEYAELDFDSFEPIWTQMEHQVSKQLKKLVGPALHKYQKDYEKLNLMFSDRLGRETNYYHDLSNFDLDNLVTQARAGYEEAILATLEILDSISPNKILLRKIEDMEKELLRLEEAKTYTLTKLENLKSQLK